MTTQVARFPQTPTTRKMLKVKYFLSTRKMLKVKYCFFTRKLLKVNYFLSIRKKLEVKYCFCLLGQCWKVKYCFFVLQENAESQILFFVFLAKKLYWVTWVLFGSARKYVFIAMHLIYGIKSKGHKRGHLKLKRTGLQEKVQGKIEVKIKAFLLPMRL